MARIPLSGPFGCNSSGGKLVGPSLSSCLFEVLVPGSLAAAVLPLNLSEMMSTCQTVGCNRVYPGVFRHCCSDCGTAVNLHSRRCQRLPHRLWRAHAGARGAGHGPPTASMTTCSTHGCGRLAGPGYDACCSRCSGSQGHSHNRRCQRNVAVGLMMMGPAQALLHTRRRLLLQALRAPERHRLEWWDRLLTSLRL